MNRSFVGPATTQNFAVKFDGEIRGGVLVGNASDDFPSKRSSKISFQTSLEVRHRFRQKLRQLHSGNRWCLHLTQTQNGFTKTPFTLFFLGFSVREEMVLEKKWPVMRRAMFCFFRARVPTYRSHLHWKPGERWGPPPELWLIQGRFWR